MSEKKNRGVREFFIFKNTYETLVIKFLFYRELLKRFQNFFNTFAYRKTINGPFVNKCKKSNR